MQGLIAALPVILFRDFFRKLRLHAGELLDLRDTHGVTDGFSLAQANVLDQYDWT